MNFRFPTILHYSKKVALLSLAAGVFAFAPKMDQQDDEAYYVYSDKWEHGIPTGFMGEKDGISLKLDDAWKENPYKGEKCIRFKVDNSEAWRGLHIQYTGGWNISVEETTVLPDLTGYEKLEFYARAEGKNGEVYLIQDIGVGGGGGFEDKKADSYLEIGPDWKRYTINLKGMDLKRINTLMFMTLPEGTLYMDEIRFIKKKKK